MQTVTSSEFCRIVKKVSKESKEKLSLGHMGENHGTCEETGKQHGGISRYKGSGMYEKCGSELERPYRNKFNAWFALFLFLQMITVSSAYLTRVP